MAKQTWQRITDKHDLLQSSLYSIMFMSNYSIIGTVTLYALLVH